MQFLYTEYNIIIYVTFFTFFLIHLKLHVKSHQIACNFKCITQKETKKYISYDVKFCVEAVTCNFTSTKFTSVSNIYFL